MDRVQRPFRVFDLPRELRDRIWGFVFDESLLLDDECRVSWWKAERMPRHDAQALKLFRASRQIHTESMIIYYMHGAFRIMLDCKRRYPVSTPPLNAIGKMNNVTFLLSGIEDQVSYQRHIQDYDPSNPRKLLHRILHSFSGRKAIADFVYQCHVTRISRTCANRR